MAHPSRRVPPPNPSRYYSVPQSPQQPSHGQQRRPSRSNRTPAANDRPVAAPMPPRSDLAHGVATGAIGAGYGPYSHHPSAPTGNHAYTASRFSVPPSEHSSVTGERLISAPNTSTVPAYMWDTKDPDLDDALHNPDARIDAAQDHSFALFSARGWANVSVLVLLMAGLVTLFAGYPIISFYNSTPLSVVGDNFGGANKSGQVPDLPNAPTLIDKDTDKQYYTKVLSDGRTWNLVFSDEFNSDGRTFWPGDDAFWEAVDLHYWPTGDLEWYDPQAITTEGGKLVITMTEESNHNLNFRSGMLQSWNKFCFTTGYVEVSLSLPGTTQTPGFWPAVWSMGNLGRAGYGATTDGMWPYTYVACDVGTFPNQTQNGQPAIGSLSYLPGQRLSACTCSGGDHPGPDVSVGRGAPEIDILEAQINVDTFTGQVSQSLQVAPFNLDYYFNNGSTSSPIQGSKTKFNVYRGGPYQQALSALSDISSTNYYNGSQYTTYAYEWWSDPNHRSDGYVQWYSEGKQTWKATYDSLAGDSSTGISNRVIPEEPMYLIVNLGMAPSFQEQDFAHMKFPSKMYIDYIRVYQRDDVENGVTCNPSNRPTTDYIKRHLNAYSNPNLTTWSQAGYSPPKNSKYDGC